jgi:hypothetical protein
MLVSLEGQGVGLYSEDTSQTSWSQFQRQLSRPRPTNRKKQIHSLEAFVQYRHRLTLGHTKRDGLYQPTPTAIQCRSREANALSCFGAWQVDLPLHPQFNFTGHLNLQRRSEFFNLSNHPNFDTPSAG